MGGRGYWLRRGRSSRGQTETIGVVLILAMTLIGATVALAFGATALDDARISSQEGGIEQAMTQLDARGAMVGLGDSPTQRVPLAATGSGGYRTDPDAGWIRVTHHDWNDTGSDVTIYNETLGALIYERDEVTITYQGGGVWRSQRGNTMMVSPPEFHYQSATLTLPVLRVRGNQSAGGSGIVAEITQRSRAEAVYPNLLTTYPDGTTRFVNPIRQGNVTVTIHSEYYQAWADYFRTRTSGEVTVDQAAGTARVKLVSIGAQGDFSMPADGNSIELRGLGSGHPINDFTIRLRPDDTDSANFANLQWSLYADGGSKEFEVHLRDGGENDLVETGDCTERDVDVTIYYSETNGDPYHGWHADSAFRTGCEDLNGDGNNETFLDVNLTGTAQLSLEPLSSSELQHFSASGDTHLDPVTFDEHEGEQNADWESKEFNATDPDTTIYNLTNHYLSLMGPTVELTVKDKGSDTVKEEASSGTFEQEGGAGRFITYLQITENRIEIDLG